MKTLILPLLFLLTFVFSCRDNSIDENLEKNVASVDLYIAGAENNQACYWKNGQKVILPNGTGLYAMQIIVENNNVYVYGAMTSEYLSGPTSRHLYLWKNNVRLNLDEYLEDVPDPNPSNNFGISNTMTVQNGDIYFYGYIANSSLPSNNTTYCYWKNGVKNIITNGSGYNGSNYNLIDNNIYSSQITNLQPNPTITGAYTWEVGVYKNTTYSPIATDSSIRGFYKDSSGIYAYVINQITHETYFKNIETSNLISFPTNAPGEITSVLWDGDDKYYIGDNFYYKNNTLITLNEPNGFNRIRAFNVKDNQIYTIRYTGGPFSGTLAKVFINDTEVMSQPLTSVIDPNVGGLLSIFID